MLFINLILLNIITQQIGKLFFYNFQVETSSGEFAERKHHRRIDMFCWASQSKYSYPTTQFSGWYGTILFSSK